ncbi:LOW QUALITY PROTEIN: odorant receptor 128-10 [Labrus mixtus]|uniref:LOW QUALITY PROTEIN: odorant receptor 128-10 n=1 Tax=Labrus mixtus TaxID=508554 RepID=UPI0029C07ED9|nr:LOW QUALITY PROTEIN: odorant receptor 128-10 [Labrus mixtus]
MMRTILPENRDHGELHIVFANLLLIVLISVTRSLHEPMYVFMCSLFVNELFCSTWLFPFLLVQILSDTHNISASFCFLQIFCVYSYGCIEYVNLVIMAYDRYLAICFPLQYNQRMTTHRVVVLISLSWLFPFLGIIVVVSLIVPLQFCGNIINKVYCDNYSTVKLACSDTTIINMESWLPLDTILFVIFMERISKRSLGKEGFQFGGFKISSLLFADDVVLLASSCRDLQQALGPSLQDRGQGSLPENSGLLSPGGD